MNNLKNLDIEKAVAAVIADDPDAAVIAEDLARALAEAKAGRFARKTVIATSPIMETRHKTGLSQNHFAAAIGISPNTLKSWEQGQRTPSGAAKALLKLLNKHPELIADLRQP
ncbi:MAG: type II toxin-antitoxin system MqsA family antitoxin [Cardiobacteriaceae bacterium]|nr:type II toxin-antitoxin system MqsA family antitoxin [Cardiobacteriaceae bacterium]